MAFAPVASYFTLNVSSPNTPGLRDLQKREALDELLARVVEARDTLPRDGPRRPLLLKIAPDVTMAELDDIVDRALAHRLDGMIVSNTTICPARQPEGEGHSPRRPAASRARPCSSFPRRCSRKPRSASPAASP